MVGCPCVLAVTLSLSSVSSSVSVCPSQLSFLSHSSWVHTLSLPRNSSQIQYYHIGALFLSEKSVKKNASPSSRICKDQDDPPRMKVSKCQGGVYNEVFWGRNGQQLRFTRLIPSAQSLNCWNSRLHSPILHPIAWSTPLLCPRGKRLLPLPTYQHKAGSLSSSSSRQRCSSLWQLHAPACGGTSWAGLRQFLCDTAQIKPGLCSPASWSSGQLPLRPAASFTGQFPCPRQPQCDRSRWSEGGWELSLHTAQRSSGKAREMLGLIPTWQFFL